MDIAEEIRADERPLVEYAGLTAAFLGVMGGFLALAGSRLPERIGYGDLGRLSLATYKVGRLVAKDHVTSFVRAPVTEGEESGEEQPKREGLPRALGELVTCPTCVGLWAAVGLSCGLVLFPRHARFVTTVLGAQAISDFLNFGFVRLKDD
jgi:hypothetical protein